MSNHDFDHPVGRAVLTTRLRKYINAAHSPGTPEEQQAARHAASRSASRLTAQLLREHYADDDLGQALADYHEARGKDWRGWVS